MTTPMGDVEKLIAELRGNLAREREWTIWAGSRVEVSSRIRSVDESLLTRAADALERLSLVGGDMASVAQIAAAGPSACAASEASRKSDMDALDPKRWEVSVNVDGTKVLTIGSHGYLAGYEDIDRFGDAVRAAAEHLRSFIGSGEPEPCFGCGGSGQERWMGECGEEVGPCSICGDDEQELPI